MFAASLFRRLKQHTRARYKETAVTMIHGQSSWLGALSLRSQFRYSLVVWNGSHQGWQNPRGVMSLNSEHSRGLPNHQAQLRPQQSKCDHGGVSRLITNLHFKTAFKWELMH